MSESNTLLTSEQVSKILKVSVHTLAHWRSRGQGPRYIKFEEGQGRPVRYRKEDIDQYIKNSIRYTGDDNASDTVK